MRALKVAAATVGLSAALTGTAVGLAAPANAAPNGGCVAGTYPPASSTVALSRSRASVGMTMSYEARCFAPGEPVRVTVYSTPTYLHTKTAGAGAVLLLGGGALIVAARRRKTASAAA